MTIIERDLRAYSIGMALAFIERTQFLASVNHLTPMEERIAFMLLTPLSRREIAESLYLSEGTVRQHCTNLYAKMGVNNRYGLFGALLAIPANEEYPL